MNLNYNLIKTLANEFNDAFYILDTETFTKNFKNLLNAFKKYYPKTNIAYSYKTNYTPRLCNIVNNLGGYAEVVSGMEFEIARKLGVEYSKIYFNGPYKDYLAVEELLVNCGIVNIDSLEDFQQVKRISEIYPNKIMNVGIRINFDVDDGVISRFGFDVEGEDLVDLLQNISKHPNIDVVGLHTHFAQRSLVTWKSRLKGLEKYIEPFLKKFRLKFVSLGGGMYGNMHESLKIQFADSIPTFKEYAETAAKSFSEMISKYNLKDLPELLIEPGSALAGDAMKFCSKIYSIKKIRNKNIATVKGSIYNINPTLNKKNPPMEVFTDSDIKDKDILTYDIAGFTCIESDYLYKNYEGNLNVGDYIVFSNVGSYSIVLKPPFILPNFAVVELTKNSVKVRKRNETFNDLFITYDFED